MRIVMFYHSLLSDWNHGSAHFLRGIASELLERGHEVRVYEPRGGGSLTHLLAEQGEGPIHEFRRAYPGLDSTLYSLDELDLDQALDGADLVLVHEKNEPELLRRMGRHRRLGTGYRLLFHDTHYRAATDPASMAAYDLSAYDGVLACGEVIRRAHLEHGWAERAWTWHAAADTRRFQPLDAPRQGDLVWIGNWGDEERTAELHEFLMDPVRQLRLQARAHGVGYSPHARSALAAAGIRYAGWLPNYKVPQVFAQFRATLHVPRRPYARTGVPGVRPFEALACGVPLICSPWDSVEHLFTPGVDYLLARNGREMREHLKLLLNDSAAARALTEHGRRTVLDRHTCAHRVDELLRIVQELRQPVTSGAASHSAGGERSQANR